jgi:hypothetical protein
MNHYYHNIQGWFNFQFLYTYVANFFPDGSNFLEIGAWKGTSVAYLGVELINLNKKNTILHCIDIWEGSEQYDNDISVITGTLYNEFLNNIKPLQDNGLTIKPVKDKSELCYQNYPDKFFEFIYVDGSHYYEDVKKDIELYLPKLKSNGIFAGHDWQSPEVRQAVEETIGLSDIQLVHNTWILKS